MTRMLRPVEFGYALAALFFMTGGLTVLLTPEGAEGSAKLQAIGGLIGLYSLLALALVPGALNRALVLYWPVLVAPALAVLSLLWSVDPDLTLRRAGSLGLTTLFALWLVERFAPRALFGLFVACAALVVVIDLAVILLLPETGIHQADDLSAENHAGSWRGLFFHKNDFGRVVALSAAILAAAGLLLRRGRWLAWLLLPLAFLLVVKTNSSQSMLLILLVPLVFLLLYGLRRRSPQARTVVFVAALPPALSLYYFSSAIFVAMLTALGRDTTLTGRTEIWAGVLMSIGGYAALGGGFGAGWQVIDDRLMALTGISVNHAHNGYLDLMTDLGVVGLCIALWFMLWLFKLSFRALYGGDRPEMACLGLIVAVFSLVGNWAGSFLLLHNSIYWVLPVCAFCVMRQVFNPYASPAPEPVPDALGDPA